MTTLRMPDLGTVEGTVTLVRWLKREGEAVALGEPLFEVETDKGVSEVESAAGGTLVSRLVAEGASVAAGDPIAAIQGEGGSPADRPQANPPAGAADTTAPAAASVEAPSNTGAGGRWQGAVSARGPAPALIALARKHGLELSAIRGSGSAGAVTRQDILAARDGAARSAGSDEGAGLGALQSVVAARVSQSHREKPVYRITMRVNMEKTLAARRGGAGAPGFTSFFVKACGVALVEMPLLRRWISGTRVRTHEQVDVAVAIGVDDELFAPAVRAPAARSVAEISTDIRQLAAQARQRSLGTAESHGSCFLVSNLGAYPVESFDAIILPEHTAALAVGAAVATPVVDNGNVKIVPLAAMTLSVDHRLVNGGTAARFLTRVKQLVEEGLA